MNTPADLLDAPVHVDHPTPRILVVADLDLFGRLQKLATPNAAPEHSEGAATSHATPHVAFANGWLAAIARLNRDHLDDLPLPPRVVGPTTRMPGGPDAVRDALQLVTPNTQLIPLDPNDDAPDDNTLAHWLNQPTPARGLQPASPPPTHATPERSEGAGIETQPPHAEPEPSEHSDIPQPQPAPARSEAAGIDHPSLPQPTLGDLDLIDTLLAPQHDPADPDANPLADLAVRALHQQTNRPGLAFFADATHHPDAVPVAYQGTVLGHLADTSDPPLPPAQLTPLAAWLAHWLALDSRLQTLRYESDHDELTGVHNRRFFNRFLDHALAHAEASRTQVTVLIFDIDDFKKYNDKYGHPAGDEILTETARLMNLVVRDHDVVARIGGDEFAVIFWETDPEPRKANSRHPDDVMAAARRFQQAICKHQFPKLLEEAPGTLTISGGLATFPWDGRSAQDLVERADAMALNSKHQGKNAITFGPGAVERCELDPA